MKEKKEMSIVGKQLAKQESELGANVAMQALKLVQPMIKSVSKELTDTLGDNETIIVIRVQKAGGPASILMLDTAEDFTIQGAKATKEGKFSFTGEALPGTKKPKAIKRFYIVEEFVDLLLTGRMKELTEKLM
jgi:hypothetical protein